MEKTVVGIFDSYAQAQNAMHALIASGFHRHDLQISLEQEASTSGVTDGADTSAGTSIRNFFRDLFGMEEHHSRRNLYDEAMQRGGCLLAVRTGSEERREQAAEIMRRFNAVDIDHHSANWQGPATSDKPTEGGKSYMTGRPGTSESNSALGTQAWGGGEPIGAQVNDTMADDYTMSSRPSATANESGATRNVTPAGAFNAGSDHAPDLTRHASQLKGSPNTPGETQATQGNYDMANTSDAAERAGSRAAGPGTEALTSDDSDFREHWRTTYSHSGDRYEDYDSAYRYGVDRSRSGRFKDYRWSDAEPELRNEWEANHPESTWEKVKDAVRYAVERIGGGHHRH